MFINLLNIIVETIDEFNIFIFERVMQSGLLNEQILLDPVLQEQFVEVIKDRLGNKDRFYIIEKYKEYVIFEYLEKGFERRNNNEVNESSCITYLKEKLESFYLLKHAQEIVSSVRNADQNMSLGMIKEEDLKTIKGNIFGLLDDLGALHSIELCFDLLAIFKCMTDQIHCSVYISESRFQPWTLASEPGFFDQGCPLFAQCILSPLCGDPFGDDSTILKRI